MEGNQNVRTVPLQLAGFPPDLKVTGIWKMTSFQLTSMSCPGLVSSIDTGTRKMIETAAHLYLSSYELASSDAQYLEQDDLT